MKKFLVVLLSLGLVMAFSMSAFAVTPDFTGQYYARGSYASNPSLLDQGLASGRDSWGYYDQRLRMFFRLKIVEGVTFTTRFDALETVWGKDQDLFPVDGYTGRTKDWHSPNFSFEQSYVDFATGIGQFRVGYRSGTPYGWGTKFMDAPGTAPGFGWTNKFGNLTLLADVNKTSKGDMTSTSKSSPNLLLSDADTDYYDLGAIYKFKGGEAGFLWTYFRDASGRAQTAAKAAVPAVTYLVAEVNSAGVPTGVYKTVTVTPAVAAVAASGGNLTSVHNLQPYAKTKIGPVDLEAEAYWMMGKTQSDVSGVADVDIKTRGLYVNAKYNMGPAYVGGIFMYASGDDPTTSSEKEGGYNSTLGYGTDTDLWGTITPAIMFNDDYHDYLVTKGNATTVAKNTDNVWMYQLYGGYAVTKKLDLNAKFSFMKADKVAAKYDDNYGTELDVKATYKIYDKLSYNVGAAYLWTGDYFKGTSTSVNVSNNYLLQHWIDLRF
jgi:hypothetical protein